jgi:hypothetical protein
MRALTNYGCCMEKSYLPNRKYRGEYRGHSVNVAVASMPRETVASALYAWVGDLKSGIKRIAAIADCSPRTAENWIAARNMPSGEGLIALMRESDEVFHTVLVLANRMPDAERLRRINQLEAMLKTIEQEAAE